MRLHSTPPLGALPNQRVRRTMLLLLSSLAAITAQAQTEQPQSRGALLYTTHCVSCHSTQMHWRDASVATDWDSLKHQVRKWQDTVGLRWTEADITEVARHLNDTIYRHPQTSDRVSQRTPR